MVAYLRVRRSRNGPGNGLCPICLVPEDCNHIFFRCLVAQFLWSCFREVVGGKWYHDNLLDLFQEVLSLPGPTRPPIWMALGTLAWTLWCCRNKLFIERVIPCRVTDAIYKLCGFLQLWRPLSKQRDRNAIDIIIAGPRASTSAFAPPPPPPPPPPETD